MGGSAELAAQIERRLRAAGTAERAAGTKAYLKSGLDFTGVTVPDTRRIVRELLPRRAAIPREHIAAVTQSLWARPVFECRLAAVMLLTDHAESLLPQDAVLVERLIRDSGTWALVDDLAGSGVTVREAVKPLPPGTAARLLAAYRARRRG